MLVYRKKPKKENKPINKNYKSSNSYFYFDKIPYELKSSIQEEFITPIEKKFLKVVNKLKSLSSKEANDIIKKYVNDIKSRLNDTNFNLNQIKIIEAKEDIADIALSGFDVNFNFSKGLQLNVGPSNEKSNLFFDVIRKFIFDFKDDWSNLEPEYFILSDPKEKLICSYWPLYAYIKTLFYRDFKSSIKINDIFSLSKMQSYTKEIFKVSSNKQKGGNQNKGEKKGEKKDEKVEKKVEKKEISRSSLDNIDFIESTLKMYKIKIKMELK